MVFDLKRHMVHSTFPDDPGTWLAIWFDFKIDNRACATGTDFVTNAITLVGGTALN